jgi:hypothetical protein
MLLKERVRIGENEMAPVQQKWYRSCMMDEQTTQKHNVPSVRRSARHKNMVYGQSSKVFVSLKKCQPKSIKPISSYSEKCI